MHFLHLFVMQLTPKNLTFPKCLSYSLEGSKWQKKGFHNIFVIGRTKIWILKCGFLAFLGAKMTKIEIQNPKLFVINDYQQFSHILSGFYHFQISDAKHEFMLVKLKVCKNGIFWAKNLILKKFPMLFLSPNPSYIKKSSTWVL